MTYGGTVPTITPLLLRLQERRQRFVTDHSAHLLDHGHELEPGSPARPTPPRAAGPSIPNYTITYAAGTTTVTQASLAVAVTGTQANQGSPSFIGSDSSAQRCDHRHQQPELQPGQSVDPDHGGPAVRQLHLGRRILPRGEPERSQRGELRHHYTSASGDFTVTGGPVPPPPPPPPPPPRTATHRRTAIGSSALTVASSRSARPSSTVRPAASSCSDRWSASCPRETTTAIGSMPPTAGSSATATPSSTDRYRAPGSIPPGRASRTASTLRSSAWCRRPTEAGTSWWPPTAASLPSATPGSRVRAQAWAAARALRSPSCPTPPATGTG